MAHAVVQAAPIAAEAHAVAVAPIAAEAHAAAVALIAADHRAAAVPVVVEAMAVRQVVVDAVAESILSHTHINQLN